MPEINARQAAEIIGVSVPTIHRKVAAGALKAREQGTDRKFLFLELDELRKFARRYGYRFNEEKAAEATKEAAQE